MLAAVDADQAVAHAVLDRVVEGEAAADLDALLGRTLVGVEAAETDNKRDSSPVDIYLT